MTSSCSRSLSLIRGSVESSAISKRRQKINGAENQRKSSPTTAHTHAALGLKFRFRSKSAHRLSEPFTLWALIIIRFLGVGARRALYLSFERKNPQALPKQEIIWRYALDALRGQEKKVRLIALGWIFLMPLPKCVAAREQHLCVCVRACRAITPRSAFRLFN